MFRHYFLSICRILLILCSLFGVCVSWLVVEGSVMRVISCDLGGELKVCLLLMAEWSADPFCCWVTLSDCLSGIQIKWQTCLHLSLFISHSMHILLTLWITLWIPLSLSITLSLSLGDVTPIVTTHCYNWSYYRGFRVPKRKDAETVTIYTNGFIHSSW